MSKKFYRVALISNTFKSHSVTSNYSYTYLHKKVLANIPVTHICMQGMISNNIYFIMFSVRANPLNHCVTPPFCCFCGSFFIP